MATLLGMLHVAGRSQPACQPLFDFELGFRGLGFRGLGFRGLEFLGV